MEWVLNGGISSKSQGGAPAGPNPNSVSAVITCCSYQGGGACQALEPGYRTGTGSVGHLVMPDAAGAGVVASEPPAEDPPTQEGNWPPTGCRCD